jgi:acetylornithine deacetylase/succinyl-diaminopimelate desuccinylase-like protein
MIDAMAGGDEGRAGVGTAAGGGAARDRCSPRGYAAAATLAGALLIGVAVLTQGPAAISAAAGGEPLAGDQIVELLRSYIRIDTSNPPGNELRAARFFKELFDREGIPSEIYEIAPGRANIIARLKGNGSKRPLLLMNHMDVVNAERPYWSVEPFAAVLKDGYVYGRGALDMKTTGLLEAVTLINLRRSGRRLSRDLIFFGSSDEEVDAAGITWLVQKHPDLIQGAEFALNEGGVIDAVDGAAKSYNVTVTEKVPFWIKIIARGRPGHGSQPFEKDNAMLALLRSLQRLAAYETPIRVTPAAEAYFKARAASEPPDRAARYRDIRAALQDKTFRAGVLADPSLNAILRDTIAITMLQGSPQTNIIPTVAQAQVDIRLLPGTDPQEFLKTLRSIVEEPGVTIETVGTYLPATESPVDSELVKAIDRARARHHPQAVLAPTILTGWTESAMVRSLGIQAYGFEPYVLDESEQERTHGNDERISVENIRNGAELMREIVVDVAR